MVGNVVTPTLSVQKRKVGVEPTLTAPQAVVLPLHHDRHGGMRLWWFFKVLVQSFVRFMRGFLNSILTLPLWI